MDRILLGHGSGGKLMHSLIREHFAPVFELGEMGDAALLRLDPGRIAFTTDSYVVSPLFFPGGDIGELAVYGTVNDLSVAGARPLYLTAGFIIEEGFLLSDFRKIVRSMSHAAERSGIKIVAGDTKVVNRGKGDGVFINTSGIGGIIEGADVSASRIRAGDCILVSGEVGNHGTAIIAERNGITFDPPVVSDTAPLNGIIKELLRSLGPDVHFMRDPTRGGLATTLKEAALECGLCMKIKEGAIPVAPQVTGASELLGLDPLYVANEGIFIAMVEGRRADEALSVMRSHPLGGNASILGRVEDKPEKLVLLETAFGGTRIMDMLEGEQLPRIC